MLNPKSLLDYKLDELKKQTNFSNSDEVSKYLKDAIIELSSVTDPIVKEIIIKRLSDDTNISMSTISGMLKNKKNVAKTEKKQIIKLNKYEKSERELIFYMIRYPEVIKIYKNNKCYFPTQEFRYLVNEIVHYCDKNSELIVADFLSYLSDKKELLNAFNVIDTMEISDNYTYEQIMDYINELNEFSIKVQIERLMNEFKKETDSLKK